MRVHLIDTDEGVGSECRHSMHLARCIALCLLAAGCGAATAPNGPETADLPFQPGPHLFHVLGDSFECGDLKLPQAGVSVAVDALVTRGSGVWIVRPASGAGGDFEVRLQRSDAAATVLDVPLAGSITGHAIDSYNPTGMPTGTRATFGISGAPGGVPLRGRVSPTGYFAQGQLDASIEFSRNDASVTCPAGIVRWVLSRRGL